MTNFLKFLALLTCMIALPLSGMTYAQSVEEKLATYEQKLMKLAADKGYKFTKITRKERSLGEGGKDIKKLDDLEMVSTYFVIGACDEDCSGLGLSIQQSVLLDGTSQTVVENMTGTDMPIVEFLHNPFGDYTLEISMLSCSTLICGYGVDIYKTDKIQ